MKRADAEVVEVRQAPIVDENYFQPRFANLVIDDEGKLVPAPWSGARLGLEQLDCATTASGTFTLPRPPTQRKGAAPFRKFFK